MALHALLDNDNLTRVLSTYPGRDKAIRALAFYLQLKSTTSSPETAKNILALAKQLSAARLVLRQFNHPSMLKACDHVFKAYISGKVGDPVEFGSAAAVTGIYTVYGVVELLAWLSDAKILRFDSVRLYKWCLYLWIAALVSGITRQARVVYLKSRKRVDIKEDVITATGLTSDLISAVHSLPHPGFLWAGKLTLRQSATFSLIASVVGFYKLW